VTVESETAPLRALVVTNMYPTAAVPYAGPFVATQVESLRAAGVEVEVLHLNRQELGRSVYRGLAKRVQERVAAADPDLVHVAYGGVMADTVTRSIRDRPVLVTFHGTDLLGGRAHGVLNALSVRLNVRASHRAARRAAGVIVVSETLLDALPRSLDRSRVWVVPNGVDLSLFQPRDRVECQRALGWDPERTHVLFPSSPSRAVKRFGLAEASAALVNGNVGPVELHALDGVPHDDVPTWLNAANAILLTSAHEASPVIVKEALACNVPVVSVDVGDVRERIARVDGCFIADPHPEDLAEKLKRALARREPIAGREHVEDLSLERIAGRVQGIYAFLTKEARTATGREA
jgi:teichuronic acid biosynthesis glycosyltransferase TuaC